MKRVETPRIASRMFSKRVETPRMTSRMFSMTHTKFVGEESPKKQI